MSENRISSSKREIYSKLLDIAEKYTDIENTDYLKTGLFGWMMESMAVMMRDSTYHKDMIYRESFLNTAMIPASVYNWAKMFNIEVQKATPAYADIEIKIDINSMIFSEIKDKSYGSYIFGKNCLILDKKNPIIAGDYYYALEHSIAIFRNENRDKNINTYMAKYLVDEEYASTDYMKFRSTNKGKSSFLTCQITNNTLIVKARAYQYKTTQFEKKITSSSFLNKVFTFEFEDQFCGAALYYFEGSTKKRLNLQYSTAESDITAKNTVFYNLTDEHTLELIFRSEAEYFSPASNSTLKLYLYTTKGAEIPAYFNGTAIMNFREDDLKSLPMTIEFNPINIIGGKNTPSLSKIKQSIINELSTRNTITTKNDLNNYFDILTSLIEEVNDGRVTFVKERDDILRRVYNAYLLLRDNTDERDGSEAGTGYISSCVPTNTIDIAVDDNDVENYILPYSCFSMNGQLLSHSGTHSDGEGYYFCPFVIYVRNDTINKVEYIYDLVNQTTGLEYSDDYTGISSSSKYMIPIEANLYRGISSNEASDSSGNPIVQADSSYTLSLKFNTNFNASEIEGKIKVKDLKLYLGTSSPYIQINDSEIECSSEDAANSNGSLFLTTMKIALPVGDGTSIFSMTSDNYVNGIYINNTQIQGNASCHLAGSIYVDSEEVSVDVVTSDNLEFYQELNSIMDSDMIKDSTGKLIGLSEVPVIHSSFFNKMSTGSETRVQGFISQLFTYINILKENLNKLETSTFFNIKFYNTYGPSYYYDTTKTNLDLEMNIVLEDDYVNNTSLKKQILSYIRRLIDSMNATGNGIRISNVISTLQSSETFGNYINYVEFNGLNGTYNQFISKKGISIDESLGIPIEWLNVDAKCLDVNDNKSGITFNRGV